MKAITIVLVCLVMWVSGCASNTAQKESASGGADIIRLAPAPGPQAAGETQTKPSNDEPAGANYIIGPGDVLQIFVWRNPELSVTVPVRPDGKISIPLVEDLVVIGRTPNQVARSVEMLLSDFIKNPLVTIIITQFGGVASQQIRIIGAAVEPKALPYREGLSLLDVMISAGGLTEFAAGNRAKIVRKVDGKEVAIPVKLHDLLKKGDISANRPLMPGDILIIPESWF
ncbi:MAG: XrtA/PEP-CTERM system exopolysaccharide export protein [Pseudomonadota bacterium]